MVLKPIPDPRIKRLGRLGDAYAESMMTPYQIPPHNPYMRASFAGALRPVAAGLMARQADVRSANIEARQRAALAMALDPKYAPVQRPPGGMPGTAAPPRPGFLQGVGRALFPRHTDPAALQKELGGLPRGRLATIGGITPSAAEEAIKPDESAHEERVRNILETHPSLSLTEARTAALDHFDIVVDDQGDIFRINTLTGEVEQMGQQYGGGDGTDLSVSPGTLELLADVDAVGEGGTDAPPGISPDLARAARLGTGFWSKFFQGVSNVAGGVGIPTPGDAEEWFPNIVEARYGLKLLNEQLIKIFQHSARFPIWEQERAVEIMPEITKLFRDPDSAVRQYGQLLEWVRRKRVLYAERLEGRLSKEERSRHTDVIALLRRAESALTGGGASTPTTRFSQMTADELGEIAITSLTDDDLEAYKQRLAELQNG